MTFSNILVVILFLFITTNNKLQVEAQTTAAPCKQPTLQANQRWISSPGCSGAYNTGTEKCHCYGKCGYICEPLSGTGGTGGSMTVAPGTCSTQNQNGPATLGSGQEWVAASGCPFGPVFQRPSDSPTQRCHCWGYCGYVCGPYVP